MAASPLGFPHRQASKSGAKTGERGNPFKRDGRADAGRSRGPAIRLPSLDEEDDALATRDPNSYDDPFENMEAGTEQIHCPKI